MTTTRLQIDWDRAAPRATPTRRDICVYLRDPRARARTPARSLARSLAAAAACAFPLLRRRHASARRWRGAAGRGRAGRGHAAGGSLHAGSRVGLRAGGTACARGLAARLGRQVRRTYRPSEDDGPTGSGAARRLGGTTEARSPPRARARTLPSIRSSIHLSIAHSARARARAHARQPRASALESSSSSSGSGGSRFQQHAACWTALLS